jgi:hypothetical protein
MFKSTIALVVLGLSLPAAADSHFAQDDLNQMMAAIQRLDHTDNVRLSKYFALWDKHCAHRRDSLQPCFIKETDFDPQNGRKDYVLFFRGEGGIFPTPGVSMTARQIIAGDGFCGDGCSYAQLATLLEQRISAFSNYDFDVYRNTEIFFDIDQGTWKVSSLPQYVGVEKYHDGDLIDPANLPKAPKTAADSSKYITAMGALVSSHVSAGGLVVIKGENKYPLDAMISLTASPRTAYLFSQQKGRLLVVSVPKRKILTNEESCTLHVLAHDEIIDTNVCTAWVDTYSDEIEYDAGIFLKANYVYDSLTYPVIDQHSSHLQTLR